MCNCKLDRRALGRLLAGASTAAALAGEAEAATVAALAITCIDYRLVDDAVRFFNRRKMTNEYDNVALAGAALAGVSDKFPASNAAFWDQIGIAKTLHHIRKVIVIDHRDCGAYKVAFGKDYRGDGAAETAQHKTVMEEVKAKLARTHPDLEAEFYLMALDGHAERVV